MNATSSVPAVDIFRLLASVEESLFWLWFGVVLGLWVLILGEEDLAFGSM